MPLEICAAKPRTLILVHKIFSINRDICRISLTSCTESQRTGSSMSFSLAAICLMNSIFNNLAMIVLSWPCTPPRSSRQTKCYVYLFFPECICPVAGPGWANNAPTLPLRKVKDIFDSLKCVLSQANA
jgi:hypothetical protein